MRCGAGSFEPSSTSRALLNADSRLSIASSPKLSPGDPSFSAAVRWSAHQLPYTNVRVVIEGKPRLTNKHSNHLEISVQEFVDNAS